MTLYIYTLTCTGRPYPYKKFTHTKKGGGRIWMIHKRFNLPFEIFLIETAVILVYSIQSIVATCTICCRVLYTPCTQHRTTSVGMSGPGSTT